ncbi:2,3-dihydroxybenzoate-AMP ligase [Kushneria avicenniae]|uniref:2,3-dihydroxybenzoate-AMP ligase n=1 Tax=Kushneria avicenniae TaxID=402385 RepID=A0A1I1LQM9_9GAMM|nr:AMP-binding protein [Kushneria avicenniae]SFC75381.1 2,3-dihydroxybenzoate-AMP ligase [Kushneria avicenniae]
MTTTPSCASVRRATLDEIIQRCPDYPSERQRLYRDRGCWIDETFGAMMRRLAETHGTREALVDGELRLSYADLDRRVDALARGLRHLGLERSDRVVIQLPNRHEFVVACFALFRLGALPVFALPAHRRFEVEHFCRAATARALLICDRDGGFDYRAMAREVREAVPTLEQVIVCGEAEEFTTLDSLYEHEGAPVEDVPSAHDLAFFQLSGGTTGVPKLIPRRHDDYHYSLRESNRACAVTTDTVYLVALPIAHNFPMSSPGFLGVLLGGGRLVIAPRPSPDECFVLIERERVTMTSLVPPLAMLWLDSAPGAGTDLSSLDILQVGGAKLVSEAARRVAPTLGCRLQQVFGMAEGLVNYTGLDDPIELINTTQGQPMSALDEVLVVDDDDQPVPPGGVGHLITRGPYTIPGYFVAPVEGDEPEGAHNQCAFTADGFYRTGDRVQMTPDGYLIVEGRDKDQINRGGEKVAAEEVENQLLAHDSVHDVAVVAMPDPYLGERVCAFVVVRGETPKPMVLARFLRDRGLAHYKVPERFEFLEAFPQTGVGKISKKALRQTLKAHWFAEDASEGK